MTSLTYNNFELKFVKTNLFAEDARYSPGNVEYLYTRFLINVTAIYNEGATSYPGANSPAITDTTIRHQLMQPRRELIYKVGNDTIISSPAGDYNVDANNGPTPIKAHVHRITGTQTWHVEFEIETFLVECPNLDQPPALLSNRWTCTDMVDRHLMTTKHYRGISVFRTDRLDELQATPDHFRNVSFPPIPLGFKRIVINATVTPEQNALIYEVVDQEQVVCIGDQHTGANAYGVTEFDATYYVGTIGNSEGGAASPVSMARCEVMVWGERDTTNYQLILFAIKIIYQKLQLDAPPANGPVLRNVSIQEKLQARYVQVSVEVMVQPSLNAQGISILDLVQLRKEDLDVFVQDFTSSQPYDKGTRGSHKWEILGKVLQDACTKQGANLPIAQGSSTNSPYVPGGGTPTKVTIGIGTGDLPYQSNKYSTDAYHDYQIDVRYENDQLVMRAPVASADDDAECSIMFLAAPTTTKIVHWKASRHGSPPKMPNPEPTDDNLVLLSWTPQIAVPSLMPDASSPIYSAEGTYVYAMKKALKPGDSLKTGVLPWTTLSKSLNEYNNYDANIIDDSSSTGGGTVGISN